METTELSPIFVLSLPMYKIETLFEPCCCFADNIQKNFQLREQEDTIWHQYHVFTYYNALFVLLRIITNYLYYYRGSAAAGR